jgi:hypothetical protein
MHRNNKNYLRDYLIKKKKESLRKKSVEAIIQENTKSFLRQGT